MTQERPGSKPTPWPRRLLPVLVLLVGAGVFALMLAMRKKPQREAREDSGILVEVLAVHKRARRARVTGHGTVQPRLEAILSPQVAGTVLWVNPSLVVGGRIKAKAALLRIDPIDYKLAVEKARARLAEAKMTLAEAESNAAVARREWKSLGRRAGGTREASPLTLYKPQLELARAGLASAQAEVRQAEVNLARTTLRAPFDLRVRQERVERGQYARVGQELLTVYGTKQAEVIVSLPADELHWIDLPRLTGKASSDAAVTPARVRLKLGGEAYERAGRLLRTVGEMDPTSRMSKVVVGIDDPYNYGSQAKATQRLPDFELGAFVEVEVEGRDLPGVVPIPASAVRLGSVVWVVGAGDKLSIRKVRIARMGPREALVAEGLAEGERVVLTTINGALDGMKLRIHKAEPKSAKSTLSAEASSQ